jgi:ACS family 4-hydroxyphenylacetate permease-like MFS transporter
LFLIEGLPSIVLGFVTYYYLRDSPADAKWLTDSEKGTLNRALERSRGEDQLASAAAAEHSQSLRRELLSFPVMMLAIAYFGLVNSLSFNSTWVPQIVRALVPDGSFTMVGLVNAVPSLCTIAVMPFWCAHSDRTGERTWHMVIPILLAACGWMLVVMVSDPVVRLVGLVCCSVGNFSAQSVFWSMATSYLSRKARPVGVALVSSFGVSGSFVGPLVVGYLRDSTGSFAAPLLYVMICLVCGAACLLALSWRTRTALVQPAPATA